MGRGIGLRGIAVTLATVLAASAAQAETLKLAIPQRGAWDTSLTEIGVRAGFFKEVGLDIEMTYTEGGAANEQAVISGSVDIAMATGFLGILAAYVKGAPVRIISPEATGAPDIFWYAKADSPIKSLKDTHGKTVAFSNPGSSSNLILLTLLKDAGVSDAKTVPVGAAPNAIPLVMTGQVDVGWATPPAALKELDDKQIVIVARGNDSPEIRNETVRVIAVNLATLQKNRDALIRFMQAYRKSVDYAYSDPKALETYAEIANMPLPLATRIVKEFFSRETNQTDEIKGEQRVLDEALAAKRIPRAMKPEDIKGVYDFVLKTAAK
jgi:NitT/TauT family transport system substrate-binding protein